MIIPLLTPIMIMPMPMALSSRLTGKEVYRQFQGTHTGSIALKVGEKRDVLTVFLDHDEEEFFPEASEEDEDSGHDDHGTTES